MRAVAMTMTAVVAAIGLDSLLHHVRALLDMVGIVMRLIRGIVVSVGRQERAYRSSALNRNHHTLQQEQSQHQQSFGAIFCKREGLAHEEWAAVICQRD